MYSFPAPACHCSVSISVDNLYEFHGEPKTMRRYHHIGIPTTEAKPGETHLKHLKLFVVSHEKSEFGVEWMRLEADAVVPDLVRQVPHVAFEVADLASELAGRALSFHYPRTQQECPSFS